MAALGELIDVMDRLRSPGGCPWDAEQTHASLLPHLVEETYELIEAVDSGNRQHVQEELGDVLLQVVFHARVAQEDQTLPFDLASVARGVAAKLKRRHPHVFGDATASTPAQVQEQWAALKQQEKGRRGPLEGLPAGLPSLHRAATVLSRLRSAGLDAGIAEHRVRLAADEDVGRVLLAVIAQAQERGIDADAALRRSLDELSVQHSQDD
jgi:XTP/dITP diphosphohydrolase